MIEKITAKNFEPESEKFLIETDILDLTEKSRTLFTALNEKIKNLSKKSKSEAREVLIEPAKKIKSELESLLQLHELERFTSFFKELKNLETD